MKILNCLIDKIATAIVKRIDHNHKLRVSLMGLTGAMGMAGPGADELFNKWRKEHNKPNAKIEEFLEWFNKALNK